MSSLQQLLSEKISALLPDKFAIVFDGWSSGITHYVAVFATFVTEDAKQYEHVLFAFSPMGEEEFFDAQEHVDFVTFVLSVY
eukprot:IDg21943t1